MRPKIVVPVLLFALALSAIAVAGGVAWFALQGEPAEIWPRFWQAATVGLLVLLVAFALAWWLLARKLVSPLNELAGEIETLTHTAQARGPLLPRYHMLPELARAVDGLLQSLKATRQSTEEAIAQGAARAESDKSRLEAILVDLAEGVIVCNRQHRILLYNQAAARILNSPEALGLGRLLFNVVPREPIEHSLEPLLQHAETRAASPPPIRFVCSANRSEVLLHCRLGLVVGAQGDATGYVLSFTEHTHMRSPLADLFSTDLFRTLARRLAADDITLTPIGLPHWLRADSHGLLRSLSPLLQRIAAEAGIHAFDIEARLQDKDITIQISWDGTAADEAELQSWLGESWAMEGAPPSFYRANGRMGLRIPVRPAQWHSEESEKHLPPRPEFYDFDLFQSPPDEALQETPLSRLRCVVFDTETTGLRPSEGDEIISIGAIRVVNGRILSGETFNRLINPGRSIPAGSTAFHRITHDMVADKPPASVVLPQFKDFVGRSVLVAYNAAFDLKFLSLKERASGVSFDNPVLDVLLLAAFLHAHAKDHSLEAIARRLSVMISGRHTALGDAIATAALFVAMIEPLKARGVETLAQAIEASNQVVELRKLQEHF